MKTGTYDGPVFGENPHDVAVKFLVAKASRTVQFPLMQSVACALMYLSLQTHVSSVTAQVELAIALIKHATCKVPFQYENVLDWLLRT